MMGVFSFLNPSRRKMAGMVNHSSRKVNRKKSFVVRLWKSKPLCRVVVLLLILTASVYSLISKDRMPVIPHLVKDQTAAYTVYAAFDFPTKTENEPTRLVHPPLPSCLFSIKSAIPRLPMS